MVRRYGNCSQAAVAFPWSESGKRYKVATVPAGRGGKGEEGLFGRGFETVADSWEGGQERVGIRTGFELGADAAHPGSQV